MRGYMARRALRAFGARYDYDVSYLTHVLGVSPAAFFKIAPLARLSRHREVVPAEAAFAAKLAGALAEDCGPCAQLVVNMAREAGVSGDRLESVLTRDYEAMTADTLLGLGFADAVLQGTPDADVARSEIRRRWGEAGVIDLTLALQIGRVFPMLKAALGYARSCERISVGGAPVEPNRDAA